MTEIQQEILGGVIGLVLGALLLLAFDYPWRDAWQRWRTRNDEPVQAIDLSKYDRVLRDVYAPALQREIMRGSSIMFAIRDEVDEFRTPPKRKRWWHRRQLVWWLREHRPHLHFGPCDHSGCY